MRAHAKRTPAAQAVDAVRGGGKPLPPHVQREAFDRYGFGFGHVRVHDGPPANAAAKSLRASAYTIGSDIGFAAGRYDPEARVGRALLRHELRHVAQQHWAAASLNPKVDPANSAYERDARDRSAAAAPRISEQLIQCAPENEAHQLGTESMSPTTETDSAENKVGFVREEGLNLRAAPNQDSTSLRKLKFGQRVHLLKDLRPHAGWLRIVVVGQVGYASEPRVHLPPEDLIRKDPALRLIKVRQGLSFWTLVKEAYGIEGNESTKDQNMNHFINAIRAFNKAEAFDVKSGTLDDIGNFFLSGRDAKNTYLKANYDLWIPSFGVAARMDVGSGTVRGEITRVIKKIDQKIDDLKSACGMSVAYMPEAIARRVGQVGMGLLKGLLDFAKDAVKILAVSTAIGALIGALFGGVGAIPGAEIGFEIGLLVLKFYGLAMLIEAILGITSELVGQLGKFIGIVWNANGDKKQLDLGARTLADAIGILVSAILVAAAAYLLKKGGGALGRTKFARTVGETRLAQWLGERQQLKTTIGKEGGSPELPTEDAADKGLATRGFFPPAGTRTIPAGIPESWRIRPTKGEGGAWYYDPANKGNAVRVMPGDPMSPFPNSQSPYVRWQRNGQPLDKSGRVLPSKNSPDAHIPLNEFKFNLEIFK